MKFILKYKQVFTSAVLLVLAVLAQHLFHIPFIIYLSLYLLSYISVAFSVWLKAFSSIRQGQIFSEFLLMGIATVGAFAIGKYAEGVAVMLFYMIGEHVQHGAVHRAKSSIKSLIDEQPDAAMVKRDGFFVSVHPSEVETGEIIQVKPGEKVPLDGNLLSEQGSFNTAALTGESRPVNRKHGEEVWAGSINRDRPVQIKVTSRYDDTKLADILALVQQAAERKAPTQRFITKFAGIYTPIVVWLAVALTFIPYFFVANYVFQEWFYRALIFLVVSCPCGLVISIPLGYFGGIGAASRNGILMKGSDFLDQLRKMNMLFVDKTGTLTKGNFKVQNVSAAEGYNKDTLMQLAGSLEAKSTHPIAKAIHGHTNDRPLKKVSDQQEISGRGLMGTIDEQSVLVGNAKLLEQENISLHRNGFDESSTIIHIAVDGRHAGSIEIADTIKQDSYQAVQSLKQSVPGKLIMLSGDNRKVTKTVAERLGIQDYFGSLLPDEKYRHVEEAMREGNIVGFAGDGINDAPVITLADVGIAMGGMGSDASIETADVVIQTDQPSKIATAIDISRYTHRIVWQNISIALAIKIGVMVLAGIGYASMWAAIFADVGVALIAIVNAVRVQQKFSDFSLREMFSLGPDQTEAPSNTCECC